MDEAELKRLRQEVVVIYAIKAFLAVFLIGESWNIMKEPDLLSKANDWISKLIFWLAQHSPDGVYLGLIILFTAISVILIFLAITQKFSRFTQWLQKILAFPMGIILFAGFTIDWLKGLPSISSLVPIWLFNIIFSVGFAMFFLIALYEAIILPLSYTRPESRPRRSLFSFITFGRVQSLVKKIVHFSLFLTAWLLIPIGIVLVLAGFKVVDIVPLDPTLIAAGVALFTIGLAFLDRILKQNN